MSTSGNCVLMWVKPRSGGGTATLGLTYKGTSKKGTHVKYIVTSHKNPHLSGVAKFNYLLALRNRIPCIGFSAWRQLAVGPILVSIKMRDSESADLEQFRALLSHCRSNNIRYDVFLHTFDGLEVEYDLLETCEKIYCGNAEIMHALGGMDRVAVAAWCPSLLDTDNNLREGVLNIFSFGMAHKIQVDNYKRLKNLLDESSIDYLIWVSTAFHEKSDLGDFDAISNELHGIYGHRIQFLGFLSDSGINHFLDRSQLFIAFFENGVRTNNTSVLGAMEKGCAVLTNCDGFSPDWMRHNENMLDLQQTTSKELSLGNLVRIGKSAKCSARDNASWDSLVRLLGASGNS